MAAPRIGVLGAGAMGSLFGGLLATGPAEVWLIDRWREHVEAIDADGLKMTHGAAERLVRPAAAVDPAEVGAVDLLLLFAKSYDTAGAIAGATPLIAAETVVITLQNGLGNAEMIEAAVGPGRTLYGVTTMGASIATPGTIEVTRKSWEGRGMTWIGGADAARGAEVAELFAAAEIPTEFRDDIDEIVWTKLAMASPMSGVAGLTELRVGPILDSPEAMAVVEALTAELVAVARASGIELDYAAIMANNLDTWEDVRDHPPSLLQDVYARRRTEVDALLGAVARAAEPLGVEVPTIRTVARLLTAATADHGTVVEAKAATGA